MATSVGAYKHLARVDADGYVLPFAGLNLDVTSRWELEVDDLHLGKLRVADHDLVARFQKMRFGCTGTDTGTPETEVRVYRDGAVVYATAIEVGEGLQNQELGFVEAESRVAFWWMFLFSPKRLRAAVGHHVHGIATFFVGTSAPHHGEWAQLPSRGVRSLTRFATVPVRASSWRWRGSRSGLLQDGVGCCTASVQAV